MTTNVFAVPRSMLLPAGGWGFTRGLCSPTSAGSELDRPQRLTLESRAQAGGDRKGRARPSSILLIEDNRADVGLVRDALEEHGVEGELIVVADGERGIRFIEDIESQAVASPDLIILDLNLPRRSGREVLALMRQGARSSQVPVVILSSSNMLKDREEAARLGAIGYFCKPASLDEFMSLGAAFKQLLGGSVS